uniref:Uncharacterized protein n=1 Tax=Arundo donax TaxID=35708 RepID=A0A0A8YXB2_ARUDO
MMERLETRGGGSRTGDSPTTSTAEVGPSTESSNARVTESNSTAAAASASNASTPCVTTSGSN